MKWPCSLVDLWPSRLFQRRNAVMSRNGGIEVSVPQRPKWAKYHVVSRHRQAGFINLGAFAAAFGKKFSPQDLFKNGEPGFHFEAYNPNTVLARRNQLLWSEDFSNAVHVVSGATIPFDGVAGAYKLTESVTTAQHFHTQALATIPDATFTYIYTARMKAAGRSKVRLSFNTGGSGAVAFDLSNGTKLGGFSGTVVASDIQPVSGLPGYYDVSITYPRIATTTGVSIHLLDDTSTGPAVGTSYTGDGVKGVYILREHHERGTTYTYQKVTDWSTEFLAAAPDQQVGMYQDSFGALPVTGVEQSVGLFVDSKYGMRRSFLPTPTAWTLAASITQNGSVLTFTAAAAADRALKNGTYTLGYLAGATVTVTGTGNVTVYTGSGSASVTSNTLAGGTQTISLQRFASSTFLIVDAGPAGFTGTVTVNSVWHVVGSHATQGTSGSRAVLRALYNLIAKSEQLDDTTAWTRSGLTTVIANAFGNLDKLVGDATVAEHKVVQNVVLISGTTYRIRLRAKAGEVGVISFYGAGGLNFGSTCVADLNAGTVSGGTNSTITPVSDGSYVVTTNATSAFSGANSINIRTSNATAAGDGVSGLYVGEVDIRSLEDIAKGMPAYQRVNTTSDYDTEGFIHYLKPDGSDDSMQTPIIDFSGVDKIAFWAGVTKMSDTAAGILMELSATSATAGTFAVFAPSASATPTFQFRSGGSVQANAISASTYPAPTSTVVVGLGDIAGDLATLRLGGVVATASVTDQGAGNYIAGVVNLFRRNNVSSPFNGRVTSLTLRGSTTPSSTAFIQKMEQYSAKLAGLSFAST